MAWPRAVLAVLLLAGALVLFSPVAPATACSCAPLTRADHVDIASAIFVGTLVEREEGDRTIAYAFEVEEVFKGSVTSTTRVTTAADGAACGLSDLTEGEDYLVFANAGREDKALMVSLCGGTIGDGPTPIEQVERLTGQGVAPEPGGPAIDDDEPFILFWALAGVGLGAVGLMLVLWRRRPATSTANDNHSQ